MKTNHLLASSLLAGALLSGNVFAHSDHGRSPADAEDYRAAVMETMAWNMGAMKDLLKNQHHFDAADFSRRANTIVFLSQLIAEGFQLGKAGGSAKPEIWDNWDDFTSKIQAFTDAATELDTAAKASEPNHDSLATALEKTGDACSSCHKAYKER